MDEHEHVRIGARDVAAVVIGGPEGAAARIALRVSGHLLAPG